MRQALGNRAVLRQVLIAHLGPRDIIATCRKLSPIFGANDLLAAQALTLRWLLATSRAANNLLPFPSARAVVGANDLFAEVPGAKRLLPGPLRSWGSL